MKIIWLIILCVTVFSHAATEGEDDDEVLVLTEDNFAQILKDTEHLLVEFYSPGCKHCKEFEPEYAKAAKELKIKNENVRLAKVDAVEETSLSEKFNVKRYPTLKFFRRGKPHEYQGGRTSDAIVTWISSEIGPSAIPLSGVAETKAFIASEDTACVGFFKNIDSAHAKAFLEVADDRSVHFGVTNSDEVFKEYGINTDEAVVVFQAGEDSTDLTKNINKKSIEQLIESATKSSIVFEFSQQNAQKIFSSSIKTHVIMFVRKTSPEFQKNYIIFKNIAVKYQTELLFIYVDIDTSENQRLLEHFGVRLNECPTYRYVSMGETGLVKYKPDFPEINADNIVAFIQEIKDKKREPSVNSQDIPDDWDAKPIKVLVGKNFDKVVLDKTKNVLVQFYATWCEESKKFAPVYEQLAETFKLYNDLVIAKLDAIANEVTDLKEVKQFPVLKFYAKDSNKVKEYSGEKSLAALTTFLQREIGEATVASQKAENKKQESSRSNREEL